MKPASTQDCAGTPRKASAEVDGRSADGVGPLLRRDVLRGLRKGGRRLPPRGGEQQDRCRRRRAAEGGGGDAGLAMGQPARVLAGGLGGALARAVAGGVAGYDEVVDKSFIFSIKF